MKVEKEMLIQQFKDIQFNRLQSQQVRIEALENTELQVIENNFDEKIERQVA